MTIQLPPSRTYAGKWTFDPTLLLTAALEKVYSLLGPAEFSKLIVAWDDRTVCRIVFPGGRGAFVKIDNNRMRHERELRGFATAEARGLTPPLLGVFSEPPCVLIIGEVVTARELRRSALSHDWQTAGALVRRLHDIKPPDGAVTFARGAKNWEEHFRTFAKETVSAAMNTELLSSREAQCADAIFQRAVPELQSRPLRLLHGDLQARHVLFDDLGRAHLIDFGDAAWGDPAWDLTVLTHWNSNLCEAVLAGYGADAKLRAAMATLMPSYSLLRHLSVALWYREHGFQRDANAAQARRLIEGFGHGV